MSNTLMRIHVEDLTFSTIIGILDFERITPQKVIINIIIDYHYIEANFINYTEVITLVEELMQNEKYELLEEALNKIQKELISAYPYIEKLSLKISKPDIIPHAIVSLSQEIFNKK